MEESKCFNRVIQIGMVVSDLESTLNNFEQTLGVGPFRIADYPPDDNPICPRTYRGRAADFKAKFCFYKFNSIELEIICPLEGDSIWFDFLKAHGPGLHHIKFLVDTHKKSDAIFEQNGIQMISSGEGVGPNAGKVWKYYDTYDMLGFYIETMNTII